MSSELFLIVTSFSFIVASVLLWFSSCPVKKKNDWIFETLCSFRTRVLSNFNQLLFLCSSCPFFFFPWLPHLSWRNTPWMWHISCSLTWRVVRKSTHRSSISGCHFVAETSSTPVTLLTYSMVAVCKFYVFWEKCVRSALLLSNRQLVPACYQLVTSFTNVKLEAIP